jgi:hypothetical protein
MVKRSLNCQKVLQNLGVFGGSRRGGDEAQFYQRCHSKAFDNASDCYMSMVHRWGQNMVVYQEQYNEQDGGEDPAAVQLHARYEPYFTA